MDNFLVITNEKLGLSILLMGIVALISFLNKLGIIKNIAIGTFRSFFQLMIMGFVLDFVFKNQEWYFTLIIVIIMYLTAAFDSFQRIKVKIKGAFFYSLISMFIGSIIPLSFMFYLVLNVSPWYKPQYIIPISSMIISNAMSCNSLVMNNFGSELKNRINEVETQLSFGLTPHQSILPIMRDSIRNGLIPAINALMVLGLAKLPGMMTGQIIGGVEPINAVKYQLLIMYMIASSNAISALLLVNFLKRISFNKRAQLIFHQKK